MSDLDADSSELLIEPLHAELMLYQDIMDGKLPVGLDDCFRQGMVYGCTESCPQLMRGECDVYQTAETLADRSG